MAENSKERPRPEKLEKDWSLEIPWSLEDGIATHRVYEKKEG